MMLSQELKYPTGVLLVKIFTHYTDYQLTFLNHSLAVFVYWMWRLIGMDYHISSLYSHLKVERFGTRLCPFLMIIRLSSISNLPSLCLKPQGQTCFLCLQYSLSLLEMTHSDLTQIDFGLEEGRVKERYESAYFVRRFQFSLQMFYLYSHSF